MYTHRQLIKLHRELWNWLADHPEADKENWPRWDFNGGDIPSADNDCFACESYQLDFSDCDEGCLFIWKTKGCVSSGSEYKKWDTAQSPRSRKYWAKKIANLKVRRKPGKKS